MKDKDTERDRLLRAAAGLSQGNASSPPWMRALGGLQELHKETQEINRILQQEFEQIEEEEWL